MLSEASYINAIYLYVGSACAILVYLAWWLGRHWRPGWVALAVLLAAALLLTPAFPKEGVDTMAPALVVAVFQYFTVGAEAAGHALRPLAFMCAVAVVLALLLRVTLLRQRPARKRSRPARTAARH